MWNKSSYIKVFCPREYIECSSDFLIIVADLSVCADTNAAWVSGTWATVAALADPFLILSWDAGSLACSRATHAEGLVDIDATSDREVLSLNALLSGLGIWCTAFANVFMLGAYDGRVRKLTNDRASRDLRALEILPSRGWSTWRNINYIGSAIAEIEARSGESSQSRAACAGTEFALCFSEIVWI